MLQLPHGRRAAAADCYVTLRDNALETDKKVVRLEYEGYVPMAEMELKKICAQVCPLVQRRAELHLHGMLIAISFIRSLNGLGLDISRGRPVAQRSVCGGG